MSIYRRHPSNAGEWRDGRLEPSSLATEADSEVWFALPKDGDEDQIWEAINGLTIDDHVELRGVPALAYDVRFGDKVSVIRSGEDSLVVDGIRERSSFATFRIWLGEDLPPSATWELFAETFAQLGCLVDVYSTRLIALASPEQKIAAVRAALETQAAAYGLEWEESA